MGGAPAWWGADRSVCTSNLAATCLVCPPTKTPQALEAHQEESHDSLAQHRVALGVAGVDGVGTQAAPAGKEEGKKGRPVG